MENFQTAGLCLILVIFFVILALSEVEETYFKEAFTTYTELEFLKLRLKISLTFQRFRMTLARLHKKGLKFLFGK